MSTMENQAKERLMSRRQAIVKLFDKTLAEEADAQRRSIQPDWADRASSVEETAVLHRLADRERHELEEIDDALSRITQGT